MDMIVLSTEMWDAKRQARKELLYKALLSEGHVTSLLYIEPMCHWWRGQCAKKASHVKRSEKVHVFQWSCPLPGERLGVIQKTNRYWQAKRIQNLLNQPAYTGVFYHPANWLVAKQLPNVDWYYDWTEDWGVYEQSSHVSTLQEQAIREVSGVITVSEALYERACKIRGSEEDVLLLPNATALVEVGRHKTFPSDELEKILSPRIGLMGHIGPWMDGELIIHLARLRPDWHWCILGDAKGEIRELLLACQNVHLLGIHDYDTLADFMGCMNVLVAPYNQKAEGDSSKLYDYLISGKPIVSSKLDTAVRLSDVVKIAATTQQWLEAIEQGIHEKGDKMVQKRKSMARSCSWQARSLTFAQWINARRL